jgi:uridine kinase
MTTEKTSSQASSLVVGIAGGSASGKTTFTTALTQELTATPSPLRVEVIGMDRYFYRGTAPGPMFTSPSTGETLPNNNDPNSADNVRLVADLDVRRSAEDAPDVILIEGLMTLHVPLIRERLDLRLFVELEADIRALRRLLRDMAGVRGSADPHWIATYYRECARVGHEAYVEPSRAHADLILRGDADFARTAPMVAAVIRSHRERSINRVRR